MGEDHVYFSCMFEFSISTRNLSDFKSVEQYFTLQVGNIHLFCCGRRLSF